jgi:hypothetical protein
VSASYTELDGWGSWGVNAQFGDVWYPAVEPGWAPFTYGNWVWSSNGWYWSSYEPYGWLVFHYGNWYYDDMSGWFWVPSRSWSPAPVNWYVYDTYVAWAPAPPRGYSWPSPWQTSASVTFAWTVVDRDYFMVENVGSHRVTRVVAPSGGGNRGVTRRSPDIKFVVKENEPRPERVEVKRVQTSMHNETYYKVRLPDHENQKVEKYKGRFRKGAQVQQPEQKDKGKGREKEKPNKGGKGGGGGF